MKLISGTCDVCVQVMKLVSGPCDICVQVMKLVSGPCDVCVSSLLYDSDKGMRSLLLSCIGLKVSFSAVQGHHHALIG